MSRIVPLEAPFAPEAAELLAQMMPAGAPPIALFRTFVKNRPMTAAMIPWGTYALGRQSSLTRRERELVILRTCARCGCDYEWGVHVAHFAERAGLTIAQLASLAGGTYADHCWPDERDRLVVETVDALHDTSDVDDDLWSRLSSSFEEPQLLDLLLLTGWYHAISFVAQATRLPPENGAPSLREHRGSGPVPEPARPDSGETHGGLDDGDSLGQLPLVAEGIDELEDPLAPGFVHGVARDRAT
jgi:alkylhydroperoxidase family enzyme